MADERHDEALAQMQSLAAEQAERRQKYLAHLRSRYGPDNWDRGTIMIFYPNPNEKDQEIRAAVKIGVNQWTLTARGNSRTWDETLEKLGPGKLMHRMTASEPEVVIEAETSAIRQ